MASPLTMTSAIFRSVFPMVEKELNGWRLEAKRIPSPFLRRQACLSIEGKSFHCAGGGMYSLLAPERRREAIRFIVAYQTLADYLDNLCDRGYSTTPDSSRVLHTALFDALTPGAGVGCYYPTGGQRDDGGYLTGLVTTCQETLGGLPAYGVISGHLYDLAELYCDLQINQHVRSEGRIPLMQAWYEGYHVSLPSMTWYEFSASCGSTLGIFALVAYACGGGTDPTVARALKEAHFPWVQGLHILLDELIDQDEDRRHGDLNFCCCYPNEAEMTARLLYFYRQANASIQGLPHARFHRLINQGLLAMYGSDPKVRTQEGVRRSVRRLVHCGGVTAQFFLYGCALYRRLGAQGLLS